ncbi:tetratricopeptide repeat protein [Candidatus Micrarchaeota archaeon]|nr:tetratricopeptide repeat protein [Candidatus Micrarchaeota archaeon]
MVEATAKKPEEESPLHRFRDLFRRGEKEEKPSVAPFLEVRMKEAPQHKMRFGTNEYAGEMRINIELGFGFHSKRETYVKQYLNLVGSIADILKDEIAGYEGLSEKGKKQMQEDFITGVWGVIYGNVNMSYGTNKFGLLSESLDKNLWDCDNSSTLVFDVAKELGIPVKMVIVPSHALVATEDFYFETTVKDFAAYYPLKELHKIYPRVYSETSDPRVIDAIAYASKGLACAREWDYDGAIFEYTMSIQQNPNDADVYANRANAYSRKGQLGDSYKRKYEYRKAIEDYTKALELNPDFISVHMARGILYLSEKRFSSALEDFLTAGRAYAKKFYNAIKNAWEDVSR